MLFAERLVLTTANACRVTVNYLAVHDKLICKAVTRGWSKKDSPSSESHHIIPRCMGGGDEASNLVRLSPREHFVVHKLLYKSYRTKGLAYAYVALVRMKGTVGRIKSSREFEKVRVLSASLSKERMSKRNPMAGVSGESHPSFTGHYITPAGRFCDVYTAAKATGIGKSTVQRRCKSPDKVVTAPKLGKLSMGKTWRELGYWFEEK